MSFALGDPSKQASANRPVSSSTSSSSSIDEALIHLTRQQSSKLPTLSKLFNDEPSSIFHFPTSRAPVNDHRQDEQQRAVHDNIQFLASMTTASTPVAAEPSWPATARQSSHQPPPRIMQPAVNNLSTFIQEFMDKLNELCYRGFDELNTLIQEQRWVCMLSFLLRFASADDLAHQIEQYLYLGAKLSEHESILELTLSQWQLWVIACLNRSWVLHIQVQESGNFG